LFLGQPEYSAEICLAVTEGSCNKQHGCAADAAAAAAAGRVCLANGVIAKGEGLPCPIDLNGRFTPEVTDFAGK
jgi:hypothetical protein